MMNLPRALAAAGLLLAVVGGCGATMLRWTPLHPPPREMRARAPADVAVLYNYPRRPYVEIGVLEVHEEDGSSNKDRPELLAELRERAGARGCDAVVVTDADRDTLDPAFAFPRPVTLQGVRGGCLVFVEPARYRQAPTPEELKRVKALPEMAD